MFIRKQSYLILFLLSSIRGALGADTKFNAFTFNWPTFGHDWTNTFCNPKERVISRNNISQLQLLWKAETTAVNGYPCVENNIVYYGDQNTLYARNATTGSIIWQNQLINPKTQLNALVTMPTVTDAAVYLVDAKSTVYAVNKTNGDLIWQRSVADDRFTSSFGSIKVVEERVIVGISSGQNFFLPNGYTARGAIFALNAINGDIIWTFRTTAANAQEGAGVSTFSTAAIDLELGYLFIGLGEAFNPPVPPLSDALIALNYRTNNPQGELIWSYQFNFNDVLSLEFPNGLPGTPALDSDIGASPNLFVIETKDCRCIKAVGAFTKLGNYKAFDRATGQLLWQTNILPEGTSTSTSGNPSAAYADGVLYVSILPDPNKLFTGPDTIAIVRGDVAASARYFNLATHTFTTVVAALNANNGKILWKKEFPSTQLGANSVANGILFRTDISGFLWALDTKNGEVLAKIAVDLPPVTVGGVTFKPLVTAAVIAQNKIFLGSGYFPNTPGGIAVYTVPFNCIEPISNLYRAISAKYNGV